jgi:hypothetical protein
MNWLGIRVLQLLRLATSVKLVTVHALPDAGSAALDERAQNAA